MKNSREQGIIDHNRRFNAERIVGTFLRRKIEEYHKLNHSDITLIYVGKVLEGGAPREGVMGVARNYPSPYHPGFCLDTHFLDKRYDLSMVISSAISCLAPHLERTNLFPYVGDLVDVEGKIELVPMPKLRDAIQKLMEPHERSLVYYLTEEIRRTGKK